MKLKLLGILALTTSMFAMTQEQLLKYKDNDLLKSNNVKLLKGKMIDEKYAFIRGYTVTKNGYSPLKVITDNKIVIFGGQTFDTTTKKPIDLKLDYSKFKDVATFKVGKGKKEILVFTEAECPYCKRFDPQLEKLKENYTIYVYMFPLNSIHFAARDIAKATLAQPMEKREAYYKKMLEAKSITSVLPELEKYSVDIYKNILKGINSFDRRAVSTARKYSKDVENAYGVKFNNAEEVTKFCKEKIAKFSVDKTIQSLSDKLDIALSTHQKLAGAYLGVRGTPSMYDFNENQLELQDLLSN